MIRLREAAAALVEDESIRLEWLNLEFRVAALAKGARYYPEPDSSIERLALSDAEGARLFFLRAQVIEEVLYRLRAGEWDSQHFQAGSLTPTPLPADWWKQRTYLDPYNETVPWEGGELTRLMVEEQAPAGSLIGANDDAPPVDKAAARKRPPLAAPARPKQKAKKRKRLDYSGDDAPLVTQMRAGIRNGTYTGPLNAARAFAGQAKGKGGEDSKALRLCRRLKD